MQPMPATILPSQDDLLIARCVEGDLDAFGALYARYEMQVYRYAYCLLDDPDEADDVKQETFLKAYRAIGSFRSRSSMSTWLLSICRNLAWDRLAARKKRAEVLCDPEIVLRYNSDAGPLEDPQRILDRNATLSMVLRAVQGMPAQQRELILLRLVDGREYDEIAAILGCQVPTARTRVTRAIRQMRERIHSLMGG